MCKPLRRYNHETIGDFTVYRCFSGLCPICRRKREESNPGSVPILQVLRQFSRHNICQGENLDHGRTSGKAEEQGHPNAQFNLGVIYAKGRGISKDIEEAKKWYKKAADQGDDKAENALNRLGR